MNKADLEKILGIKIKDMALYEIALTHRSAVNEQRDLTQHNERMEFLGDAVLELVVTEYLYNKFPKKEEGFLTSLRASLVKGDTLACVAKELSLGDLLKMSKGESKFGGRDKTSLLSNTLEAMFGAIYLDQGIEVVKKIVAKRLTPKLDAIIEAGDYIDAKSNFQQISQADYKLTPHYKELSESGPDHDKTFEVAVYVGEKEYGRGKGSSKQIAQQKAAEDALKNLGLELGQN